MTKWLWAGFLLAIALAACSGKSGVTADGGSPGSGSGSSSGGSGSGSGSGGSEDGGTSSSSGGSDGSAPPGTDGSAPKTDGGTITGTTSVQIIVEPNGNKASEIVDAINAATKSIHMTMYLLDQTSIVDALEAKSGLDVKIILNNFADETSSGSNTAVLSELQGALGASNVILSNATEFTFTHEKCIIIDDATAWIMTMNLETSSPQYNREYLAIDTEAADVAEAEAIFEADFANVQGYAASGQLVVSPEPPNNARSALVALINSATTTLDVEDEEFSDTYTSSNPANEGVTAAVAAAAARGVKTRVVLANTTPTSAQTQSITTVKAGGAKVVVSGGTTGAATASNPYIHAKAIVVDCAGTTCKSGWIGSENMTGGSLGYNRELGLFVANPAGLSAIETAISTDFAAGTLQ